MTVDPDRLLALLRDPAVESLEISQLAGVPREEAGRAARLLTGLAKAKPEDLATLPGPLAAALGRAASSAGRTDLLVALAGHASKEVAKEAKRGLHLLKARGVAVPEPPSLPAPSSLAPAAPEPPPPGLASAPDGHGERGLWLVRNVPGRGVDLAQAVVSDTLGLLELQVGVLGRKEWRTFAAGIRQRGAGVAVCELPAARVHALLLAARALNATSGQRLPEGAELWLSRLGPAPAPPQEPPRPALEPLPASEETAALAASGELHALPLFRGWMADGDHLRAVTAKLDEVAVSQLYVDERQKAEQVERILAEAAESWLTPEARARLAGRLRVAAEHLDRTGDAAHARSAAAVARALLAGGAAAELPFARALVAKAFPRPAAAPAAGPAARIDPGITLR